MNVIKLEGRFELLTEGDASLYLQRPMDFLKNARFLKTKIPGPPYLQLGRSIFYEIKQLDKWLERQKHRTAKATIADTVKAASGR